MTTEYLLKETYPAHLLTEGLSLNSDIIKVKVSNIAHLSNTHKFSVIFYYHVSHFNECFT